MAGARRKKTGAPSNLSAPLIVPFDSVFFAASAVSEEPANLLGFTLVIVILLIIPRCHSLAAWEMHPDTSLRNTSDSRDPGPFCYSDRQDCCFPVGSSLSQIWPLVDESLSNSLELPSLEVLTSLGFSLKVPILYRISVRLSRVLTTFTYRYVAFLRLYDRRLGPPARGRPFSAPAAAGRRRKALLQ